MGESYRRPADAPSVVVSGMIAGTPWQGGATWAVLQYVLGLRALGADVTFIEPISNPPAHDGPPPGATYCAGVMDQVGMGDRWALVDAQGSSLAGLDDRGVEAAARRADVLLNVAGMLTAQRLLEAVPVRVYLDLDPAFVQMWHEFEGEDMRFEGHTHFVSLSDAVGAPGSPIPACGRTWTPTLPPVVLEAWAPVEQPDSDSLTTVANWRGYGSIHRGGVQYGQKVHSMRSLVDLPNRVAMSCRLALAIHPDERDDIELLRANGWQLLDPAAVTATPGDYRSFVRASTAELGVAKSGYVLSGSGWFSDRSACYLASGRPVIGQDTGFGRRLPTGEGLLAFADVDEAAAAVDEIRRDPARHRAAAHEIAREHLDASKVIGRLLEAVSA